MNTLNVKLNPHLYEYIMDNPDKFNMSNTEGYRKVHDQIYEILEANMSKEDLSEVDSLIGLMLSENENQWFAVGWFCAKNPEDMVVIPNS